jgi:hypothetical protein
VDEKVSFSVAIDVKYSNETLDEDCVSVTVTVDAMSMLVESTIEVEVSVSVAVDSNSMLKVSNVLVLVSVEVT